MNAAQAAEGAHPLKNPEPDNKFMWERMRVAADLVSSNAVRSVRWRGNLNNGSNDGLRYCNANYAPSNAEWNCAGEIFKEQNKRLTDGYAYSDKPSV